MFGTIHGPEEARGPSAVFLNLQATLHLAMRLKQKQ
jgi:hypothetical protein